MRPRRLLWAKEVILTEAETLAVEFLDGVCCEYLNNTRAHCELAIVWGGRGETSGALYAVGFGFSIPGGATILGIEVHLERSKVGPGVVGNTMAQLLKAQAGVGSQLNDGSDWPTSDAVLTFGGPSSLWGTTWSAPASTAPTSAWCSSWTRPASTT